LLITQLSSAQNQIHRIIGSPYPASTIPDTLFIVKDGQFLESQILTIQSLQGLLAQTKPLIYRIRNRGSEVWLADLVANYQIIADSTFLSDFEGLLRFFKSKIAGYILCNLHQNSSNVAISLSGIQQAIAVTADQQNLMATLQIPELADVREKDEQWLFSNYGDQFSTQIINYQKPEKDLFLGDYAIFSQGLHFFAPIQSDLTQRVFSRMTSGAALLGWGDDEHQTVARASNFSIYVHPADWALNLSTLTNFNVPLSQKTFSDSLVVVDSVHTVCFVMTDGDNVQWILNDFTTSSKWFGNPNRGKLHLGWTIPPTLSELAPTILNSLYQQAANSKTGRDYFIVGPSGSGYMYPDQFPELDSAAVLLNRFMQKSDLNIVNIIGDNPASQFLQPYLKQSNIDAIFYYPYSNYSGLRGKISWINGKPVIGGRYNLWSGFETATTLAWKLNRQSRDIFSAGGYSLIPVHVWSNTVDDVLNCINKLQPHVRVVPPDLFVSLIQKNLNPTSVRTGKFQDDLPNKFELFQNHPNPFNPTTEIGYQLAKPARVNLEIFNQQGQLVDTLIASYQPAGKYKYHWITRDLSTGIYYYRLTVGKLTEVRKCVLIK